MKITEEIRTQLLNCPIVPPECGGIIGSDRGDIITHVFLDQGCPPEAGVMYIPDIQPLNQTIEQWRAGGIQFRCVLKNIHKYFRHVLQKFFPRDIIEKVFRKGLTAHDDGAYMQRTHARTHASQS